MVGTILSNINGVLNVDTDPANHTATVTFNVKKTDVEALKKALDDGGFPVEGEPRLLK
jgi:copper chaperone CopZ